MARPSKPASHVRALPAPIPLGLQFGAALAALMVIALPALAQAPVQTPPPNAAGQQPAFPGQTRAPEIRSGVEIEVQRLVSGLEHPWAVEVMPDGSALVTERPGRLRIYDPSGTLSEPLTGLPAVFGQRQGGLLDVVLSPDFATDNMIYFSYAEPRGNDENGTSVARGTLSADRSAVENVQVIFRQQPAWPSGLHFGSRLVFAPDGKLFITLGERSVPAARALAQDMDNGFGKLIRIDPDGSVPADNPFVGQPGTLPEIWASGFRNVQAAALDSSGQLWTIEHGPRGGDELNRVERGKNYGWPIITYGEEYSGGTVGQGLTAQDGLEQPVYYWDPVIAPSGAVFNDGAAFSAWRGDLLIGAMNPPGLVRLEIDGDRVTGEERFDLGIGRVRDVTEAPDGAIWVVTDEANGGLYRLTPK